MRKRSGFYERIPPCPLRIRPGQGITPYLETREYRRVVNSLEEGWTAFCDGLTAEQSRQLDTLLVQEKKAGYLAERAFFYSGLSVGIGLGRL